jgi:hypothetical protein
MTRNLARQFALVLTLAALAMPMGRAFAQSATSPTNPASASPNAVTGTDPEPGDPEVVAVLLYLQLV